MGKFTINGDFVKLPEGKPKCLDTSNKQEDIGELQNERAGIHPTRMALLGTVIDKSLLQLPNIMSNRWAFNSI